MKSLLAAAFLTALAPALLAQDWAVKKLEASPRHGEWVTVKNGSRDVRAFIVYPEVKTKAPAVLVIHEIFGLTDWVRGVCGQLVAHAAHPVGEPEDFVDDEDGRGLGLDLGIDDEGAHVAAAIFDRHPFAMARGGFELFDGPVLGQQSGSEGGEERGGEEGFHGKRVKSIQPGSCGKVSTDVACSRREG